MPRWLGAVVLIALGLYGVYQGIVDPRVNLRGEGPLNRWQSRIFLGIYAILCIASGLAIWLT